jgi:hypothetical protein
LKEIYRDCNHTLDLSHTVYFKRSFEKDMREGSRLPVFYGLWKVHKDKPSMHPVISCCGSFPEIFSIYINECLKQLVQDTLTTYIISSDQLVNQLSTQFPGPLPVGAKPFSVDAVGMYCYIDIEHGIEVTKEFMNCYGDRIKDFNVPADFVIRCLTLVMKMNIFQFGDMFWKQVNGTAMGTSCADHYAFLYMGLLEMLELIEDFKPWLRFIDNGLGIWLTRRLGAATAWNDFKRRLNQWGKIKWKNTGHVDTLEFLDLTILSTRRLVVSNLKHFVNQ